MTIPSVTSLGLGGLGVGAPWGAEGARQVQAEGGSVPDGGAVEPVAQDDYDGYEDGEDFSDDDDDGFRFD